RAFITAWRSHENFPRFLTDFRECVAVDFTKIYAIARQGSKVNAYQFKRFCENVGAYITPAPQNILSLFNQRLIEEVFLVEEYAFNANTLRDLLKVKIAKARITLLLNTTVSSVRTDWPILEVLCANGTILRADIVFNCAYSQINTILHNSQ